MFGAADFGLGTRARSTPRYWERAGKESNVGEFVSIGAPLSQHDTATRSGDCLRVWRIDGVAFESAEFNLVKDRHDAWCNLLRNLPAGRTAIYHHRIHRRIQDRLTDATEPEFSAAFSKASSGRRSRATPSILPRCIRLPIQSALRPGRSGRAPYRRRLSRHGRT